MGPFGEVLGVLNHTQRVAFVILALAPEAALSAYGIAFVSAVLFGTLSTAGGSVSAGSTARSTESADR
jgi:hypothetical protein